MLAEELGISLVSINFCLQALRVKDLIKVRNFSPRKYKLAFTYLLTPAVIAEKSKFTAEFLKRKTIEYEKL